MGFFDDIFIPEDALHHPSKLYPLKVWFPVVGYSSALWALKKD